MPLSSVVGAQSIVRPGVCTSSTRPASPYDGQVIYETDTDKTLVYNGTGWVFLSTSRANPGGLDFIKSQTIGSAVSSVEVTDAFSSTYDNYKITVSGGAGSAAAINLRMTLGSTITGYYYAAPGLTYGGSGSNDNGSNAAYMIAGIASTEFIQMNCDVFAPQLADRTVFMAPYIPTATSSGAMRFFGGFLNNDTQYTSFTLTTDTGTLTGGTIRVYGYVNS